MSCEKLELKVQPVQCLFPVFAASSCTVGCSDLRFCSSFNSRSQRIFASCSQQSDVAALKLLDSWQRNLTLRIANLQVPITGGYKSLASLPHST